MTSSQPIEMIGGLRFSAMRVTDLDAVMDIERDIYPFPWSMGNFKDCIEVGYYAWTLKQGQELIGYMVAMQVMEEAHLLNISVKRDRQAQGVGRCLMDFLVVDLLRRAVTNVVLEVRPSNTRAKAFYERYGFVRVGLRRGYYPADPSAGGREDAIVMRLSLTEVDDDA